MRDKQRHTLEELVSKHLSTSELMDMRDNITRYQARIRILDYTAQQLLNAVNAFISIGEIHRELKESAPIGDINDY